MPGGSRAGGPVGTGRRATIDADAPVPRRRAAWVIPTATPREASEIQLDNARVAAGEVAPSPKPSTKRKENSEASPSTAPVTIVVIDQVSPQTAKVRLASKRSASHPRPAETGRKHS